MRLLLTLLLIPLALAPAAEAQRDLGALEEALRDQDAKTRRGAVGDLAELGTAEAWQVVLERGLQDRSPRVADEAQLRLGAATITEEWLELVDGKLALRSKDELVRRRVVESLGRIEGAVPLRFFTRALKDKDAEVRASAAYAVGQRLRIGAGAVALEPLGGKRDRGLEQFGDALHRVATKDKDARARANAVANVLLAARVIGVRAAEAPEVVDRAGEVGPELSRVASMAAEVRGEREAIGVLDLGRSLRHELTMHSVTAARLLEEIGTKEAMLELAKRLQPSDDHPLRPALQQRIVRTLRAASGLSHGASAERWLRWAQGLDDDWSRSDGAAESDAAGAEEGGGSTTFFGLRIVSDRVAFLVDMSGSMWSERDGRRRKDSVEVELETALRGLPETARFNVVPYASQPAPWKGELVPASKKNVERAIQAFRGSGLRGKGNLWDALVPVLRDPEIDTVVLLTDGAPTGGTRWNVDLMRTLLLDENRFRGVTIHVLLFDASKGLQKRWRRIAEDHDGALRAID
ncbi:MAG: hypothetical protein AAGB93_09480 [Planctomycetota bacterium]